MVKMLNGFINVNKEKGMSSAFVVTKLKRILKNKGIPFDKIGHTGTLDPDGEGVLPIAVGKATRLFDYLLDKKKVYYTEFVFGKETDTLDESGIVIKECDKIPTESEILNVLRGLEGEIDQIPPLYSAKSVDGRRAYDLAREGIKFELKPKRITIYEIKYVGKKDDAFAFEITCSGGTYIRSIARDMAYAVHSLGYMRYIKRIQSGQFTIDTAHTLGELENLHIAENIIDMESLLKDFSRFDAPKGTQRLLDNGVRMKLNVPDGPFAIYIDGELTWIGEMNPEDKRIDFKARLK
ncbi:MAG: tRNA pseudouridine(55) synthase TruB [Clostridia bacterium]|nr:tRNA pseudouridine(55) synthase TruB [Clostridia bacterium]